MKARKLKIADVHPKAVVKIHRDPLRAALVAVASGVDKKASLRELTTVELIARPGILTVRTVHLDWNVRVHLKADVKGEASGLVTPRALIELLGGTGDVTLTLEEGGTEGSGTLHFVLGATEARVEMLNHRLAAKPVNVGKATKISKHRVFDAHNALAMGTWSAGTDPTRFILAGIYLSGTDMVATDGHRLHIAPIETGAAGIIPTGAVDCFLRCMNDFDVDDEEKLVIGWSATETGTKVEGKPDTCWGAVHFEAKSTAGLIEADSRLIQGQFPEYQRVIPKETPFRYVCDRAALVQALEGVPKNKQARIAPTSKAIVVEHLEWEGVDKPAKVVGSSTVPVTGSKAPVADGRWSWGFEASYMLDVLRFAYVDTITLSFGKTDEGGPSATAPCVVSFDGQEGRAVVMPMRSGEELKPNTALAPAPVVKPPKVKPAPKAKKVAA